MVASTKKLFAALTRRGPHRVLRGDLAFAGLPGVVYTPESGLNLAGVAFGHDWLAGADRYEGTLEHLASWGIVAAAPDTETGIAPSVLNLAFDLGTTLDIIAGRAPGRRERSACIPPSSVSSATVSARRGGVRRRRHARQAEGRRRGVSDGDQAAAEKPAATLPVPGLVLTAPGDPMTLRSNAVELARVWKGATLRTVPKGQGRWPDRGTAAGPGRRAARRRPQHAEDGAGADDRLSAAHADRRQDLRRLRRPRGRPAQGARRWIPFADDPVDLENKVVALLKP